MPRIPKELKGIIPPTRKVKGKKLKITDKEKDRLQEKFLEEYRKEGQSINNACKVINFTRQHVYKWTETDPAFAEEFEKLRFIKKNKSKEEWDKIHGNDEEYKKKFLEVYADTEHSIVTALAEISKDLNVRNLEYWQKTDFEFKKKYKSLQHLTRPRLAERCEIHSIIASTKLQERQNKFLDIFREKHFNVTNTCKAMGIKRATILDWYKKNPDFRSEIEALQDEKEDYVEDKLFDLIDDGNMVATIYASKIMLNKPNLGRRHAYIEQPQQNKLTVEYKHDKAMIDAVVRAAELSSGKFFELPNAQKQLRTEEIIDAEYEEQNDE